MPDSRSLDTVRVGLAQLRCSADTDANLESATLRVRDLASKGARIVCLPELFRSTYFCQVHDLANFDLAEPVDGPSTAHFSKLARELGIVLVISIFERRMAGLYHNTAVVLDSDGSVCGIYRKSHIPDDPKYHEKYYFAPGDTGFRVFQTAFCRLGVLVCWDQWYPEAARLVALQGAQILVIPTAIGWLPADKPVWEHIHVDAWTSIQRSHAIANGMFVAAVNRVGLEPGPDGGLEFWGASFVYDPSGVELARARSQDAESVFADCDLAKQAETRQNWPFLRDRRIDLYDGLVRRALDKP